MTGTPEQPARTRMPADVDAPDKILYGLTFRQMAILAVAILMLVGAWRSLRGSVPAALLLAALVPAAIGAFAVAIGRRDGLPLDVWLTHAIRFTRSPRALSTGDTTAGLPPWVTEPQGAAALPAPLRLPAAAIAADGQIDLGSHRAAIVAATTVNFALRTADEQAALIETFGRWLNSLSAATQIVVSAQPVDLHSHAGILATRAARMPQHALAEACADHARFLAELAERRDPLRRQVLITARTLAPDHDQHAARRRAEETERAMAGLGVTACALDGAAATAALASCADPYRPARTAGIAPPDAIITGPSGISRAPRRIP